MSQQLGLFLQDLALAQSETFPCEYDPQFLSQKEADDLFNRFVNWNFCVRHNQRNPKQLIKRQGIGFVSDVNHPQVRATYNRRIGAFVEIEEDGCIGHTLPFDDRTPDEVKRLRDKVSARIDRDVNYISVQIYPDGASGINWHRHSEDDAIDSPVLIVSTGGERDFHVRLRNDHSKHSKRPAQHGSLIIMPASFNDTHHHAILPDKSKRPRISINTKCLIALRVYDCHAGQRYPGSFMPELNCLNPAIYVGREVRDRRTGKVLWPATPFGNYQKLQGDQFRAYAEDKMKNPEFRKQVESLRGKHLLCWCRPHEARNCHARVWLELAKK
jgi:hypothetical protein